MKQTITILSMLLLAALVGCTKDNSTGIIDRESNLVPASVQELLLRHAVPLPIPTQDDELAQPGISPAEPPYENYDVYAVTLLWGSLANTTPTPGPTVDWSGGASINGVATIDVTHTIKFEPGQDSLVSTDNPASIAWVSQTSGDLDGLNLLIYVDKNIVYITAPVLTIATAAITRSFPVGELADLDAYYLVSNTAAFAIHARKVYSSSCATGALTGECIRADINGQSGTFHAAWWESNNDPFGYLAGNFWTANDGSRIFEGWVSQGATAMVVYYVYGTWYYDDPTMCPICGSRRGGFVGFYADSNNRLKGFVKGHFGDLSLDPAENHLALSGYWREFCGNSDFAIRTWIK